MSTLKSEDAQGTDPSELHSGSRPHPGRRQSQYSWAHMDPSAHSLAFRGGGMVRRATDAMPIVQSSYRTSPHTEHQPDTEVRSWRPNIRSAKCSYRAPKLPLLGHRTCCMHLNR